MFKLIVCLVFLLALLAISFSVIALMLSPLITGFKRAPYVPSFNYHLKLMKQQLKLRKGAQLVDLGCGDGKALRFFVREFGVVGEGYEINSFVSKYGKFLNRRLGYKDIKIIRSNFKKADLGKYDYIYMYLFPEQLASIEDRTFEHIQKDAIIISNSFKFKKHEPFEIIHSEKGKEVIRLYRK